MIMFLTLDGVAEFPDSPDDPTDPTPREGPPIWTARLASIDTLLLGGRTYGKWASFWPTRSAMTGDATSAR